MTEGGKDRNRKYRERGRAIKEGEAGNRDRQKGGWGIDFLKGHILYCKE